MGAPASPPHQHDSTGLVPLQDQLVEAGKYVPPQLDPWGPSPDPQGQPLPPPPQRDPSMPGRAFAATLVRLGCQG